LTIRTFFQRRFRCALIAASFVFPLGAAWQSPVAAQSIPGTSVTGTVTDAAGKALGDARVTAASASLSQTTRTGPDGRFSIALPPDTYTVTVAANGFQTFRNAGVTVTPQQGATLRFALVAATLQTIGRTSSNSATSINTTSAATTVVSSQTFTDQGQPQVNNVLDQIPGVEINRFSSNAPGANSSISIRGAQPYESQVLIDGHPVVTSANGAYGFNSTFINSLLLGDVEIDKGPGNLPNTIEDAVGGTLNFRTPAITGGPTGSALLGYDSFNGFYYGVRASDTFGKVGVLVGVAENETPGFLTPQTIYGGAVSPTVGAGEAFNPHIGVLNFGYPATTDFRSESQLAKVSYNFSPQTSILLEQYSTQTNNDETGTNYQYVNATIVPCIDTPPAGFAGPGNCAEPGGTNPNYTSPANSHLIGTTQPINLYAPYPNTSEFDNEPIYSAEFRTVAGPGSFLARYYTGTIDRIITQNYAPGALSPCTTPACPPTDSNIYDSAPYVEDTIDILHGVDAQYTVPFGGSNVTLGFDRHVDTSTFGAFDPASGPPSFAQNINVQSIAYNIRGNFALTKKLTLESGNYLSSTSYVGTRFDPRDGLIYQVNPNAALRASYGTAYSAPFYDLINPTSYVSDGVLNLATGPFKPETSAGYDVGTDFNLGRNTLVSFDGYLTHIFNRYATVTQELGTTNSFDGAPYSSITQNGNQANVREEGLEFKFLRAPRVGLGFSTAADLLRDYAYGQNGTTASASTIFGAGTPADNVQLPSYPYSKIRNDLFYTFANGARARFSSTTYGANNSYGETGFTEFDGEVRLPLEHGLIINIGATNIFNHDDNAAAAIYNGGYTYPILGGGAGYTTLNFVQPRTLFIQLERSVGRSGAIAPSRTSL
jgi:outer membrane receptor protein involved in Fe transport